MSRYAKLVSFVKDRYAFFRTGSHALCEHRYSTMLSIISDLSTVHALPFAWEHLNEKHIQQLVSYWKSSKVKPSTIMNRLSVMRHFSKFIKIGQAIPSNSTLGIAKEGPVFSTECQAHEYINRIKIPAVKILLRFAVHFGLTKHEVLSMTKACISDNKLIISRKIAFNGIERQVPIMTAEQMDIVHLWKETIGEQENFGCLYTYDTLITLCRHELRRLNIKSNCQYRACYVQMRMRQLSATDSDSIKILQQELGVSRDQIKRYLHTQSKI